MLTGPLHGGSSEVMGLQMSSPHGFTRIAVVISILVLVLALLPPGVTAHAPSGVLPAFDEGSRILSVSITHPVADPSTHYIRRVLVTAGGSTLTDTAYTSQPTANTFTYSYPLPQAIAGEVHVKAECSIAGSITSTIQVPENPQAGITVPEPSIPVPVIPPLEPVASGTGQPPAATVAEALPPAPAPLPTKAGSGFFPLVAALALALAGWRLRR